MLVFLCIHLGYNSCHVDDWSFPAIFSCSFPCFLSFLSFFLFFYFPSPPVLSFLSFISSRTSIDTVDVFPSLLPLENNTCTGSDLLWVKRKQVSNYPECSASVSPSFSLSLRLSRCLSVRLYVSLSLSLCRSLAYSTLLYLCCMYKCSFCIPLPLRFIPTLFSDQTNQTPKQHTQNKRSANPPRGFSDSDSWLWFETTNTKWFHPVRSAWTQVFLLSIWGASSCNSSGVWNPIPCAVLCYYLLLGPKPRRGATVKRRGGKGLESQAFFSLVFWVKFQGRQLR